MNCQNPRCSNEVRSSRRKFCSLECRRQLDRGHTEPEPVEGCRWIELGGHRFSLVDARFYDELQSMGLWSKTRQHKGKLAAHRYDRGVEVKLHHWVMRRILGPLPAGFVVDHINGDSLDNRAANLRLATWGENCLNGRRFTRSGYRGVYQRSEGRCVAGVTVGGRRRHLGTFQDPETAARAYDAAARSANRSFALLNFPAAGEQSAVPVFVQTDEVRIRYQEV